MRDIHYQELRHEREVLTFGCVCLPHWPLRQDLVLLRSHAAACRDRQTKAVQYESAEWKPAFLRQAREFLFLSLDTQRGKQESFYFRQGN